MVETPVNELLRTMQFFRRQAQVARDSATAMLNDEEYGAAAALFQEAARHARRAEAAQAQLAIRQTRL